jgi:hypothetical protein
MDVESLAGLKAAFEEWRSKKRYEREAIPAHLLERARLAARRYGPAAVARATKVDRGRLKTGLGRRSTRRALAMDVPTFSRVELAAPATAARPFAEVETATGLKVRLFAQTDAALELLSSLCGVRSAG